MCNNRFLSQVIGNNANCESGVKHDKGIAKQEIETGLRASTGNDAMIAKRVMVRNGEVKDLRK